MRPRISLIVPEEAREGATGPEAEFDEAAAHGDGWRSRLTKEDFTQLCYNNIKMMDGTGSSAGQTLTPCVLPSITLRSVYLYVIIEHISVLIH